MFNNLKETIKELNADANKVVNSEKAKKLKKKLLSIGLPLTIISGMGVLISFILFILFSSKGKVTLIIVALILCMVFAVICSISAEITSLGMSIVISEYTTNLINETVGNNCHNCGETITSEMIFCSKCGTKVRKECSNCKHINSYKNDFCEKCGTKLD